MKNLSRALLLGSFASIPHFEFRMPLPGRAEGKRKTHMTEQKRNKRKAQKKARKINRRK